MTQGIAQTHDYEARYEELNRLIGELGEGAPQTMAGFAAMHEASAAPGAIDGKTKELLALAIGIAVHCDGCIAYHAHDAIEAGASREEIAETIAVAVMMGGGPSVVYGSQALEAADQFLGARA
ncbi:MAG TPA: carboxymuconolactone decarboxylase family protein [Solirubrobacterales bacterium]|nr:carboxymuconolactone decarboxylase family protein [Solirubrobacterales bacterium]